MQSKSTTIPTDGKHIAYDRLTKDYAMYLDGQYIGSARTHSEATTTLDTVATEQAQHLAADLADEAATPDTCEICTESPATVTVRSQGGVVRVCRPCFDAGWDQNEHAGGSWEADFDDAALTPAEAYRAAVMRERDILDVDLAELRKAVDGLLNVGVLAALVSSGCYPHSRQLLVSDPAAPDWALAEALATFVGRAA